MNDTECPQMTEDQFFYLVFSEWLLNGIIQMFICIVGEMNYLVHTKLHKDHKMTGSKCDNFDVCFAQRLNEKIRDPHGCERECL